MSATDNHILPVSILNNEPAKGTELVSASESTISSGEVEAVPSPVDRSSGSLGLGKPRSLETPQQIDPEDHITPRATNKAFNFPKSN